MENFLTGVLPNLRETAKTITRFLAPGYKLCNFLPRRKGSIIAVGLLGA